MESSFDSSVCLSEIALPPDLATFSELHQPVAKVERTTSIRIVRFEVTMKITYLARNAVKLGSFGGICQWLV